MAEKNIVGRKEEIKTLRTIRQSKGAEFLAVYGRRRVGKTFLIREYFSDKGIFLETSGVKNLGLHQQLENFTQALSKSFFGNVPIQTPSSWKAAFELLTQQLQNVPKNKKAIIFLDELPWLAAQKSGLLPALDFYWNQHWSRMPNFILIVCGSAASWMLEHIVNAKGGLYNRITKKILLKAFNLKETEDFLRKNRKINLSRKQIADLYMAIGGIPFYLKEVKRGCSTSQIIDDLCFQENGILYSEFSNIFKSLFDQADVNERIILEIAKAGNLISREQLIKATKITSGGTLNKRLEELEASQFIKCFVPLGKKTRDRFYRIIDEYTLFYLQWIEPLLRSGTFSGERGHWHKILKTPARITWSGYAFEGVCFKHIPQIAKALGIAGLLYESGSWRHVYPKKANEKGAQIDLLFDREDDAITLCEIKYSDKPYAVEKSYAKILDQKLEVFQKNYPNRKNLTRKQIFFAMVTAFGVKQNIYSEEMIHNEVTLEDLFE
ncbi:MAG: AAA family ATPase [Verrucomicrobia bacterium]|nr:AAA family ATPase [Verrucomicrobiota bacterium]